MRNFSVALCASVCLVAMAQPVNAQTREFNIRAGSLKSAIDSYARQSGRQVIYRVDEIRGAQSPGVRGRMAAEEALAAVLRGSGFVARTDTSGAVAIVRQVNAASLADERPQSASGDLPDDREIVVTGTNIRGLAPESSPVQIYKREEIRQTGVSSTEQFIRTLPQNAGGGSSEFAARGLPNDANSQQNNTFGTGANLRGLGSRGTLVLLNGNRLAPTSKIGDFVDVSLIPLSALERVEVLTDGASSIYGGDAVAGVINFVLRDDFEGSETSLRYGAVTRGSLSEYRVSQTLGTAWSNGNILATYEYRDRGNLLLSDRPEIDPPLFTGTSNPVSQTDSIDLLPQQKRHSAVVALRQGIGSRLEAVSTFLYSNRKADADAILPSGAGIPLISRAESESISGSVGLDYEINTTWETSLNGNFSQVRNNEIFTGFSTNPPNVTETVTKSDLWSVDARLNGTLFDLPGGAVKVAAGGHFRQEDFRNQVLGQSANRVGKRDVASAYGELFLPLVGPQNAFPGAERFELSFSGRYDDYSDFGGAFSPKFGAMWSPVEGLKLRGSYSKSFAPPSLGRTGALDRGGSIRPYQAILTALGLPLPDPSLAGVDYLIFNGTAADLKPEKSRAFTAGVEYTLDREAGSLTVGAGYYDIRFRDRLSATPIPGNVNVNMAPGIAFADPGALPPGTVIFFPSQDEINQIISTFVRPPSLSGGGRIENVGIINAALLIRNLSLTHTRGIDFNIKYKTDTTFGTLSAGVNANYIIEFLEQASPTTPKIDILNSLFNPVDLKMRANLSLSSGGFSGSLFANYTDSYATDSTAAGRRIDSWTTFDLALSYAPGNDANWSDGLAFSLSISNLFDVKAPTTTSGFGSLLISGYDPANASPLGRFVSLELRKSF